MGIKGNGVVQHIHWLVIANSPPNRGACELQSYLASSSPARPVACSLGPSGRLGPVLDASRHQGAGQSVDIDGDMRSVVEINNCKIMSRTGQVGCMGRA